MIKKHSTQTKVVKEEKGMEDMPAQPKLNWSMVAVVAALAGVLLIVNTFRSKSDDFKNKTIPDAIKKVLNSPNTKFEVTSVKETNGVYEFQLKIQDQTYNSFITKDGKVLFQSGIKLDEIGKTAAKAAEETKKLTVKDLKKADKSTLTAFVVANCPYGIQTQRVFKKVMEEVPAMVENLKIKYIGAIENGKITSMHGEEEAKENMRQICIRDEQNALYWPYVNCYMQEGKTDACLANVGVDTAMMTACTEDPKRGNAFAQKDFDLAKKFKVGGSPTLLLNDQQIVSESDFGGRVPNAMKTIVCGGSKTPAEFCSKDISTKEVAVSLSITDEAAASAGGTAGSAAGCAPATPAQ
jgi:thioredoxin-related protein